MSLAVLLLPYAHLTVTIQFYENISFITPKQVVFWYIFTYKKEEK